MKEVNKVVFKLNGESANGLDEFTVGHFFKAVGT